MRSFCLLSLILARYSFSHGLFLAMSSSVICFTSSAYEYSSPVEVGVDKVDLTSADVRRDFSGVSLREEILTRILSFI